MLKDTLMDFTVPESFELRLVVEDHLEIERPVRLNPADSAAWFLHDTLGAKDREHFGVLFLDTRERVTGYHIAHVGTRQRLSLEPYSVFAPALLINAASVIVFHNHPSADPSPSRRDVDVTHRLAACGRILGVPLLDHLILGKRPTYVSLMGQGSLLRSRRR